MSVKLQRPLLMSGAVLAGGIWALDILEHWLGEWSVYALLIGTIGAGAWWMQQKPSQRRQEWTPIETIDATQVQRALSEATEVLRQAQTETTENATSTQQTRLQPHLCQLETQIVQIETEMARQELRFMVMGSKGSGKTALLRHLTPWAATASRSLTWLEAPSFAGGTASELTADRVALRQAMDADLVVYVITGDLTASELHTLQQLSHRKRTLLVLNKQDQFLPADQPMLLARIQQQVRGVLPGQDVMSVTAAPNPIKVRQHQADGSVKEWLEEPAPTIAPLLQRLDQIVQQESQQLVLASSFVNAVELKTQAKTVLNDSRRQRALPVVEQFQWIAAAAAFASPVPTVDVVATVAINGQMILDLGAIYRQKLTLQQAQKIATTLGGVMLKLGLVEVSTQAIASLLKTNAFTYVAGGCAQGVSAAYFTRLAGLSLIEYFHSQEPNLTLTEASPLAIERLTQIIQTVFQQNQQGGFLQTLTQQVGDRLFPQRAAMSAVPTTPKSATSKSIQKSPAQKSTSSKSAKSASSRSITPTSPPIPPIPSPDVTPLPDLTAVSSPTELKIPLRLPTPVVLDHNETSVPVLTSDLDTTF